MEKIQGFQTCFKVINDVGASEEEAEVHTVQTDDPGQCSMQGGTKALGLTELGVLEEHIGGR